MSEDDVAAIMEALSNILGAPEFVRMDNGAEMTINTADNWYCFSVSENIVITP